jgi:2-deoxy-D-gluconate 3-dehydrogenase
MDAITNSNALKGKVALVTGSSRGLGRGIALGLASYGADLVLTSRDLESNLELAGDIQAMGRRALALAADIMKVEDITAVVDKAIDEFGAIDILVNNAGTNPIRLPALEVEEWAWDKILDTNLKGLFFFTQAAARHMVERGEGKIINISSAVAESGSPLGAPYGASKAGVNHLTRTFALELAPHNINVNAIGLSFFEAGMSEPVIENEDLKQAIILRTPLRRLGRIEDLVNAVLFLASGASEYITGHILFVDGGWTA